MTECDVKIFLEALLWSLWFPFSDALTRKLNVFFGVCWKLTHLPGFSCLSLHTHLYLLLLRGSGSASLCSHSSRFPAPQPPTPIVYWCRLVHTISSPLICLFLSSSLCLIFVFLCDSFNLWFPVLWLPTLPPSCIALTYIHSNFFFPFVDDVSIFSQWNPLVIFSFALTSSYTDKLTMTIITITLYRSSYYYSFCTLFGRLLYRSSHFHHSLNGLSPATSSSRSHSCSPSPLSISLGGPAFLPGSSRPQCENWRWRGRRWRRDNHWSRPQSVFLVTNCRASLSSC